VGMAIASFEWLAAIMLVFVAWWLLPKFLRVGIYTMPEYLEYRYDGATRSIMAGYIMVAYVVGLLSVVLYSGALAFNTIFDFNAVLAAKFNLSPEKAEFWANFIGILVIAVVSSTYTIYGGLKAVAWSDLFQGAALLLGGLIVTITALNVIGEGNLWRGWESFTVANADKLHTVLPWNDPEMPWLAVFVGGLWIPNIFYWGLNQFITQRALAAKNLAEGQKGVLFAAVMKLCIPFIIVLPGVMAYQLYQKEILSLGGNAGDKAYAYMLTHLLPAEFRGFMFAALLGAVMSTFNSGLNSAATIFTIDFYKKYFQRNMGPEREVRVGRVVTTVIVIVACLWAPVVASSAGVFRYIQEIWGFISPGIVAAFIVGMAVKKTPPIAAKAALILSPVLYALCRAPGWVIGYHYLSNHPGETVVVPPEGLVGWAYRFSTITFLHHMAMIFIVLAVVMIAITHYRPLKSPVVMPVSKLDVTVHPRIYLYGILIIAATATLYLRFW
jgi:solute:Na+ symporter, SSS family